MDNKKDDDFSEWYNEVIDLASLSDKRYPIKGMNIWTPYGWKIMRSIDAAIRSEFDSTGHEEVCFPLLIPKDQFDREAQHIKGFNNQVYWVTHAGDTKLDVPLLLRPTSETAMYYMFSLWVRNHADMPLKIYQIVNVFRYETKQTRSFMRVREIHFFEAHTVHKNYEDAELQVAQDKEILKRLARHLCIPYLLCRRPEWDKFAGAHYSLGIDAIMPNGKSLQIGSIHQYRDNFAKAYNIEYEDETGGHKNAHQTTFGMAERLLGAIIGLHGDDKGLRLPSAIAPLQVVIIPILAKGKADVVMQECKKVEQTLKDAGFRVSLDERDLRPGNKFFHWELRGVPIRLELGMRDIEKGECVFARRDSEQKSSHKIAQLADEVHKHLQEHDDVLYKEACSKLDSSIKEAASLDEAKEWKGVSVLGWCGKRECGQEVENQTGGGVLGVPEDGVKGGITLKNCIACGGKANHTIYAARTF